MFYTLLWLFKKEEGKIIGFIYEFMSNGTLDSYIKTNLDQISEEFSMMTIIRIIQGIDYLHSNSLINCDLKPLNILLDHDFISYISDFETIHHPFEDDLSDEAMIFDFCSYHYSSPEQNEGGKISYPTDIYSLGMIFMDIFEKSNKKKNSNLFHKIYEKCTLKNQDDRLLITQIELALFNEFFIYFF